jgi:hypothetical protein
MKALGTKPAGLCAGFMRPGAGLLFVLGLLGLLAVAGPVPGLCREPPRAEGAAGNHGTGAKPAHGRFEPDLEHHLAQMESRLKRSGYAGIFLAVLVEGVGILAPGQMLLLVGAIAAARGEFKIIWVLAWALLGPVLGAYFLDKDIAALHLTMRRIYPWAVALSLLTFLALMVYLVRHRRTGETHQ